MRQRVRGVGPVWARGFRPPELPPTDWRLEVLRPALSVVDHAAWSSCRERLVRDLDWNGWPAADFTLQANTQDLADHLGEFERNEAYAYSVLSGERCVGCVYVEPWAEGAQLAFWFVDDWLPRQGEVVRAALDWLATWPAAVVVPVRPWNPARSMLGELGLVECAGPEGFVSYG